MRGEWVKKSLNLTSWEAASDLVNAWTASGEVGVVKPATPTIKDAVAKFIEDAEARELGWEAMRKYRNLLENRFLSWCDAKGYRLLKQVDVDALRSFRAGWDDGASYAVKNLERMRAFFRFCHQAGWITANPALAVKPPKLRTKPTLPFTSDEMERIIAACDRYRGNKTRVKAFLLVMRYSGLRIGDTVTLRRDRLNNGGNLQLYTAKTGTPVFVPLPAIVVDALAKVETANDWFFWTGNGKVRTAVAHWERSLQTIFELAEIDDGKSHRFRDTAAVSWLLSGISIEDVAVLLGHENTRVTLRHYSPWVKERQVRLESLVRKSWDAELAAS